MTAMRIALLALAFVIVTFIPADAATLPLKDGDYTSGSCEGGHSDITESIGLYTLSEGKKRGERFVSPDAENQDGYCTLGRLAVAGNRFSGTASCEAGNLELPSGTYRFTYDVINPRSFVSRGKTYRWCAEHR